MAKPTSGERIEAFMEAQQLKPRTVTIEAWWIRLPSGGFSWRATVTESPNDLQKDKSLWETWYQFSGKRFQVNFCSVNKVPMQAAIAIAAAVVDGKTVKHDLVLE